jgi:hypothetical protein
MRRLLPNGEDTTGSMPGQTPAAPVFGRAVRNRSEHHGGLFPESWNNFAVHQKFRTQFNITFGCEVDMLDLFYVGIVIAFFVLLWGFTRASEKL